MKKISSLIYVLCAPSGAGKTSLVNALLGANLSLHTTVSHTTRSQRPGEIEGKHYHFVRPSDFQALKEADEFVESAYVFGQSYGTSKKELDRVSCLGDVVLDIDWQGALSVKRLFPSQVVTIFIFPPSMQTLRERLRARAQDDVTVIERRMQEAKSEISRYENFEYLLVNDNFQEALSVLCSIVAAERHRRDRQLLVHGALVNELLSCK